MANIHKGEVEITVDGQPYTLKLSVNAAAVAQSRHKKSIGALMNEAATLDFVAIRAIVWLLLQKFHAKQFPTEDKVGDFMDEAGGLPKFMDAIQKLAEANNEGLDPNPKAQESGISESSTSAPSVSA